MRILAEQAENSVKCKCGCIYEIRINDVKADKEHNHETEKNKIVLFFTKCPMCGAKNGLELFGDAF